MRLTIRDAEVADEADWRRLWALYNRFHEQTVAEPVSAATWRRILDPGSMTAARLAEIDGVVAGFCITVLHECTWTPAPVCYLEDLYVDAAHRGCGLGRALIQDVVDRAHERGLSRVYWHTNTGNAAARRLYDGFRGADDVVRYTLAIP